MRMCTALLAVAGTASASLAGGVIAGTNFDGGDIGLISFTSSDDDNANGAGDMFGVRSRSSLVGGFGLPFAISDDSVAAAAGNTVFAADNLGIFGQAKTDNFFGVVDSNNTPHPGTSTASWIFNISGASGMSLAIDIGAIGDFESSDNHSFAISIDGGTAVELLRFEAAEAIDAQTYRAMDSGLVPAHNDPLREVTSGAILDKADAITGALDTFLVAFSGSGSTLELIYTANQDSGSEAFAFDNIQIRGVPAPGTLALLGLGGFAAVRRRRA